MTRLESFVDAAFAFAVTMLVIAGQQVPDDIPTLLKAFKNVPAFAASIAVLAIFWRGHWLWSRRFGLEDTFSIWMSWALIFTMLVYVYPLKLVFSGMFYSLSNGALGLNLTVETIGQGRELFAVYAIGFSALALEILLLNWHAWRRRDPLQLDEREQRLTRNELFGWSVPLYCRSRFASPRSHHAAGQDRLERLDLFFAANLAPAATLAATALAASLAESLRLRSQVTKLLRTSP